MIINHNMNAMNAHRNMGMNTVNSGKSMEKLSSGLRINRAGDDAAGLAISEKMRGQIRGLDQASRNAQDGISLIQTAEGALNETHSILQRMRELVVQGGTGINGTEDLQSINDEITTLNAELDGISTRTEFNGKKLLDGTLAMDIQIGANAGQQIEIKLDTNMDSATLTVKDVKPDGTKGQFDTDIAKVDVAIKTVSEKRSGFGATQNRLEHTIANLNNASENLTAAESRVRDVDMAKEMINFSKNNILSQASQAMLAQAKSQPEAVLQLLR